MSTIPEHYSAHEVNQLKLKMESEYWISLIKFFTREMEFYSVLISSEISKKNAMEAEFNALLNKLEQEKAENSAMLNKTLTYSNQVDGLRECEDSACDTFYLNDHEKFRGKMEDHKKEIQALKNAIFEAVEKSLKI
ncbi:MAG TPA: hypothetical protein VFM59_07365 [Salinimicrobium sp.]|nr:hypothetical protein [Salinimicrobium sp.]